MMTPFSVVCLARLALARAMRVQQRLYFVLSSSRLAQSTIYAIRALS